MIRQGDRIKIKASRQLLLMQLGGLCGRSGIVTEVMLQNKTPGAMIKLDDAYEESRFWYVPAHSIVTERMKHREAKNKLLNEKLY